MTTTNIALSQLSVSDKNVRVVMPDKASHQQLMASIASQGVLQNLVVVPGDKARFEVIAGGRRLRALQALAKQQTIPMDYPVPCLVKTDPDHITEISLAENIQQAPMHPADQFEAFAALAGQGIPVEDIAARFGVTRSVVEKRLKLGRVAPGLLKAYRGGALTLESLMAFTVSDDTERQLACYQALAGRVWPQAVKHWLLGEAVDASRGIGAFVGKAAYLKAGGAGAGDLFADTFYLSDAALVCELAQGKLARAAKRLAKAQPGWAWIDTTLDRYQASEGLVQLQAELVGVPAALEREIEALEKQIGAWEALDYDEALDQGFEDEDAVATAIEAAQTTLDALKTRRDDYLQFSESQKAHSGCLVTFDHAGKLLVLQGLARRKDIPKTAGGGDPGTGEGGTPETSPTGLSQALLEDLGRYRQQATQAALLQQPAAAADVLHYTLCLQVLSDQRWQGRTLQDASFGVVASTTSRGDTGEGRAFDELARARDGLSLQWLELQGAGERFAAYRQLPQRARDALVAYCTARTLTIGVRGHCADQDSLIAQLGVDFAGYWRPTRDNYLGRLTKGALFAQFGSLLGQQWLDWHASSTKAAVVASLDEWFRDQPASPEDPRATWIPAQF